MMKQPVLQQRRCEAICTDQSSFFPSCCLSGKECSFPVAEQEHKRPRKFITLCKNNKKKYVQDQSHKVAHHRHNNEDRSVQNHSTPLKETEFHFDKMDFLHQIRKYNPNPETEKMSLADQRMRTLDTTKDMNSSSRSNQNNLSGLLENLSNQMFSDMFVSSSVKGKIVMNGSLVSIPEVKSQMEMSCPSQAVVHTLRTLIEREASEAISDTF